MSKPVVQIAAAVLVLSASACIPTMAKKDYLAQHLAPKASFDLDCPAEQLKFTDLSAPMESVFPVRGDGVRYADSVVVSDMARQQGVSGCGKRASFVWDRGSKTWLMNVGGSDSQGPAGNNESQQNTTATDQL